jgi:hypothetical protein
VQTVEESMCAVDYALNYSLLTTPHIVFKLCEQTNHEIEFGKVLYTFCLWTITEALYESSQRTLLHFRFLPRFMQLILAECLVYTAD